MANIEIGENETIDNAIRRFKKACQRDGILSEIKKRDHYEKPSERKKRKQLAAKKKNKRRFR